MKLTRKDINARLRDCPGWALKSNALVRTLAFPSFADAIAFVTRLAFEAEAADHHPDLNVNYKKVTVRWTTHSDGGVTDKDFAGVKQTAAAASRFGVK
jgi:4a-hydroxytetrahydrobiopterin dehydratase